MDKFTNPLKNIEIASPCSADWDAMVGSEQKRFCCACNLNVYNLSGMSRAEAENLLTNSEGRLCVRFYKRADGTVLTKNCPVGWQAVKRRMSRVSAAFASLVFAALSGIGLTNYFSKSSEQQKQIMGALRPKTENTKPDEIIFDETNVTIITPKTASEEQIIMGAPIYYEITGVVSNLKTVKKQIFKKNRR